MSTGFRLKNALGLIPSADQLDAKWEKLISMRDELYQMEQSDELKKYEDLKNLIDSTAFQHHKREVESISYTGSKEEQLFLEWKSLANSSDIKNYYKIAGSANLNRFNAIAAGKELKQYIELQKITASNEFNQKKSQLSKKEFAKCDEYQYLIDFRRLSKLSDIKFWHKFGQSASYLSYLKTVGSSGLKRYEELKNLVASAAFLEKVAYLKDKKRFLKSEEYKKIVAFQELDKGKFMANYRKLKKTRELEFFEMWEVSYEEKFEEKKLAPDRWQPENWWGFSMAGTSFSQDNEQQGYNGLKNIELQNDTLSLLARKEKVKGQVWNPAIGLVPKVFEYSSAILNNVGKFGFKHGYVEVKARFSMDSTITSAFSLTGEKPFPQIDLFRSTKSGVGFGLVEKPGAAAHNYTRVNGLKDGKYHIFRLERIDNQLIWKVNGYEVHRISYASKEPLFFHLLTSLHGTVNEHLLPHRLEVNWIRCFEKKS